ncbi:carboxy terminal-processing peptidase [Bizionia myxarmorum]|uniref:Tail-specific protease n=1 Tax=Bizionia myxarmorum TaxID=291186 RepID=A0A5D0RE00_9FLAO|nr:carboxy terminal-processing peptidase [Bizionia myxarmorum]TYB79206.1 tail-specific protease [Bizionia myxarmorum]
MKRNYNILVLVLLLAFASCSFTTKTFQDPDKDKLLIQVITYVLENGHFDPKAMDDSFSAKVYTDYLDQIDPLKQYFYKSDIEEFSKYKTEIDNQLKALDISFFALTHDRLIQRIGEAKTIYRDILETPFDYSKNETYNADYESIDYVKNKRELTERWRQRLKYTNLASYDDLMEQQKNLVDLNKKADSLKLDPIVKKSPKEVEKEARESTLKTIDIYYNDYIDDMHRDDWFVFYINAITQEFDPHTTYFAPQDKEAFNQDMAGKLEGIGARLQKRNDNTKILELISGGPAWRGKELEVGDVIVRVRQEGEKEPITITGMRIDDAIKLIKGPKGTNVYLTVKKVDGTSKVIKITRDVVEIEETYAKSAFVDKDGKKFGIINLPKFYADFTDYKKLNAASDVKKEIMRLKEQGMQGLVLDLRNNGGGSLQTVVEMAGLFIEDGPIVQVRSTELPKEVLNDTDKSIAWDGPLVILVNEFSASASEIMAAAMQDYKRAIIIGSKQTYGKGTVQSFYDLNELVKNNQEGDLGALKVTRQKYYRINGGSVQLEGVKSDVVVPDRFSFIDIGEKDQKNPLGWDEIDAADYKIWQGDFDYTTTITNSNERMKGNDQLKLISDNAQWVRARMDEKIYPLNYSDYKAQLDRNESESKTFEKIGEYTTNLTYTSLPYEQKLFEKDTVLQDKRQRWHESLSKDVYVEEALHVLQDLKASYSVKKVASVKD